MISYDRLWIYLIKLNVTPSDLAKQCSFSSATLARMKKKQPVSLDVIDRICLELNCNIEDVVEVQRPDREP